MTRPTPTDLSLSIFQAQRLASELDKRMVELTAAHVNGNMSRIGNAAYAAEVAASDLSSALSKAFDQATRIDAAEDDQRYAALRTRPRFNMRIGGVA